MGSKLRTNEDEEEEEERADIEAQAIRVCSGQQSYSRLTAPAVLTVCS